jgi:hypothetical protein
LKKLGIKPGFKMIWVQAPDHYAELLGKLPEGAQALSNLQAPLDFIHLFAQDRKDYERRLPQLKKALAPNGMIWVSWPKAASKVRTDVTEKVVRDYALKCGLVDIKVCAVDETWSGVKMVIPVKDRK